MPSTFNQAKHRRTCPSIIKSSRSMFCLCDTTCRVTSEIPAWLGRQRSTGQALMLEAQWILPRSLWTVLMLVLTSAYYPMPTASMRRSVNDHLDGKGLGDASPRAQSHGITHHYSVAIPLMHACASGVASLHICMYGSTMSRSCSWRFHQSTSD